MANEKTLGQLLAEIKAEKGEAVSSAPRELWLPGVAVLLSIYLTPMFGTFLHMENWSALQQPARVRAARLWFVVSSFVIVGAVVLSELYKNNLLFVVPSFGMTLIWYIFSARVQIKYVKKCTNIDFQCKSWLGAIVCAFAAYIALGVVILVLNGLFFHIGEI